VAQALMSISAKEVRTKYKYNGSTMFAAMALVNTFITIPVIVLYPIFSKSDEPNVFASLQTIAHQLRGGSWWSAFLVTVAAISYQLEYMLNFTFVGYVSPVTFSVSDVARRLAIIIAGAIIFSKYLTVMNWFGISLSLLGVLWYTYIESYSQQLPNKNNNVKSVASSTLK